jgi:hypothetical protein
MPLLPTRSPRRSHRAGSNQGRGGGGGGHLDLILSQTYTLTRKHTHAHTLTLTLTLTRSHSHSHSHTQVQYLFEDGREMVEEWVVKTDVLQTRKWRKTSTLGRKGDWEFEAGEVQAAPAPVGEAGLAVSCLNPVRSFTPPPLRFLRTALCCGRSNHVSLFCNGHRLQSRVRRRTRSLGSIMAFTHERRDMASTLPWSHLALPGVLAEGCSERVSVAGSQYPVLA